MKSVSLRARVRYFFDKAMARGTPVLLAWLAVLTVVVVVVSLVVYLSGASGMSLGHLMWEGMQRILDPGGVVGEGRTAFLVTMFVVSVAGIFAVAILIGLVTTDLEKVFRSLRRGRSKVLERDHTLILGWSEHTPRSSARPRSRTRTTPVSRSSSSPTATRSNFKRS